MPEVSGTENLRQNGRRNMNMTKKPPIKARKLKRSVEKQKVEEVDKLALEYVSEILLYCHRILMRSSVDPTR